MKITLYKILLFLFPLLYSFVAHTQNNAMDSLQKFYNLYKNKIGDEKGDTGSYL